MNPMRVVVFASGRGSNARALFEAARLNPSCLKIDALICNKPGAGVLSIADEYGIQQFVIPVERQESRIQTRLHHEERIHTVLKSLNPTLICLAGYMRIMTPGYSSLSSSNTGIQNSQYTSLLPSFKGSRGYEDAFEYNVKVSGVTVHFVSEEVDAGPIIFQRSFPRKASDDLATLKPEDWRLNIRHILKFCWLWLVKLSIQQDPFAIHLNI